MVQIKGSVNKQNQIGTGKSCPVCGEDVERIRPWTTRARDRRFSDDGFHGVSSFERYDIRRCLKCGFSRVDPCPSEEDLKKVYESYYSAVSEFSASGRSHRRLDIVRKYCPTGGRLLDVGAGYGAFGSCAKTYFEVLALDSSGPAVQHLREIGIEAVFGTIHEVSNIDREFDVVTCWDVLEHLRDPLAGVSMCISKLKLGGIIVASTPDTEAIVARLFRRHWQPFFYIEHLVFFSRDSLTQTFESNGCAVEAAFYENSSFKYGLKWLWGTSVFLVKQLMLYTCRFFGVPTEMLSKWHVPFIPMWRDNLVMVARRLR